MRISHRAAKGPGAGGGLATLLLIVLGSAGCVGYQQTTSATRSIYDVKVTTRRADVASCRHVASVDSRDPARGCGLTVQPTPEECMRYQVSRAGGDTLLRNGPIGDAYNCSLASATAGPPPETPPGAPTPIPARPAPAPAPSPQPTPTRAPAAPATAHDTVRVVPSRDAVKGCVYLDDADLRTACGPGRTATECAADRAAGAGGNVALIEGDRVQIYSCKAP